MSIQISVPSRLFSRAVVLAGLGWLGLAVWTGPAQADDQKQKQPRPPQQEQAQPEDEDRITVPRIVLPRNAEKREPIQLTEMEVNARIVGLNAEVTTTLTFFNPNKRVMEGELVFPLPEGAGVTGYALDIKGQMVDGVVVKKEKARVAFETEVRRGVDPGLVEHVAGNVFRTRVYPLPAKGVRRVRIRSVAALSVDAKGDAAWRLPMPLGETIGKLNIRIEVSQGAVKPEIGGFGNLRFESFENAWLAHTELKDAKPGEDITVALPKPPAQVVSLERTHEGAVYFSVSDLPGPQPQDMAVKTPERLGIAWDASGSRAGEKHLEREAAMLKKLLASWPETKVTLLVFHDRADAPRVLDTDRDALMKALDGLVYDGGTDLFLASAAMNKVDDVEEWLLFTDGFDTLSGRVPEFGKRRVTAVVSQPAADRELLEQACAVTGGQVLDLQNVEPDVAANALLTPPLRLAAVHGEGVADVQGIGQVVNGRAAISGRLTGDATELTLEYSDGHKSPPVKLEKSAARDGELLATAWAGRRVRQLSVRADDNEDELLSLGQRFGIVSPATSLIVLETLDQYVRNDIEPPVSLPDLHDEWARAMDAQGEQKKKERKDKLTALVTMWDARVKWWETEYKAPKKFNKKKQQGQEAQAAAAPGGASSTGASSASLQSMASVDAAAPANEAAAPAAPAPALSRAPANAGHTYTGSTNITSGALNVTTGGIGGSEDKSIATEEAPVGSTITIKAWDPKTPYLRALKAADKEDRYKIYLKYRKDNEASPAFFLDCADYFYHEGDRDTAVRVLTNLAELKLEEASLLRVLAWRFEQAGELDRAIVLLRRVLKLRPEEPQSLRDLALALAERGKAGPVASDLSEALKLEEKLIYGTWARFEEIEVIALEEMNGLIAWINTQEWEKSVAIPKLDKRLLKNLDVDVRIVMSWDADQTDVDLHVLEPSGEEAFYSNNRTQSGGLVSRDFTQGYGPEEYMVRKGPAGDFRIFAHYYGSSQQTLIGPATITATVFTNFGRPTEKKEVLTLRLDKPQDQVQIGKVAFAGK